MSWQTIAATHPRLLNLDQLISVVQQQNCTRSPFDIQRTETKNRFRNMLSRHPIVRLQGLIGTGKSRLLQDICVDENWFYLTL